MARQTAAEWEREQRSWRWQDVFEEIFRKMHGGRRGPAVVRIDGSARDIAGMLAEEMAAKYEVRRAPRRRRRG